MNNGILDLLDVLVVMDMYPADPEYPVNPVHDVFQRKMSFLPFPNGMEFRETGVFV